MFRCIAKTGFICNPHLVFQLFDCWCSASNPRNGKNHKLASRPPPARCQNTNRRRRLSSLIQTVDEREERLANQLQSCRSNKFFERSKKSSVLPDIELTLPLQKCFDFFTFLNFPIAFYLFIQHNLCFSLCPSLSLSLQSATRSDKHFESGANYFLSKFLSVCLLTSRSGSVTIRQHFLS